MGRSACSLAGCVDRLVPSRVTTTGATGALHAVDEAFVDSGLSTERAPVYAAVLLRTRDEAERRWRGPPDDPVTDRVLRTDWDREFLLVLEARTPRDRAQSIRPMPGTTRQTSLSGMRCTAQLEPWTGGFLADAGDEVVFTLVLTIAREGTAPPKRARVDLHAPDGEPEGVVTVRTE